MSESESKRIFAEKFNRILTERNQSQVEIARLLQVSTSTVSSWSQATRMPRMDKIEQLAAHFGVPKSYFIEAEGENAPRPTQEDIKFALFGGDVEEITDDMFQDVLRYAQFIKEKKEKK